MAHHIYHLIDPDTHAVRYVGKSTNPKARLRAHLEESRQAQNTEKKRWIKTLLQAGKLPVMVIAASYPDEAIARIRESADCKTHLATITNLHDPAKGASDLRKNTPARQT